MSGDIPRFIDPAARFDAPVPADVAAREFGVHRPQPRSFGMLSRTLAVVFAAVVALVITRQFSDWGKSPDAPQTADASAVPAPDPANAAEPPSQTVVEGSATNGSATDRLPSRFKDAFIEPVAPPTAPAGAVTDSSSQAAAVAAGAAATLALASPAPAAASAPAVAPAMVPVPATAPATAMAPAPATAPVPKLDGATIAALLSRADQLMTEGDIEAARVLLRRAAEAHDARAAYALAATYDPAALGKLGVHGTFANLALAHQWYDKAREYTSTAASTQR